MRVPPTVAHARALAAAAGFVLSSEDAVGRLLAIFAAAAPRGGRVLEMGTGTGVGTSWLAWGVASRSDVEIVTIERDPSLFDVASAIEWPSCVRRILGDSLTVLPTLGMFDLIFADAQGGKWVGLESTIAALRPAALLVVDDMTPLPSWSQEEAINQAQVRDTLTNHRLLISSELDCATGVIVSARIPERNQTDVRRHLR
jgi:predicted O-methyltransferase YrrM